MPTAVESRTGLSGNQLKVIAMIAMTCDHVGLQLLPQLGFLRIIGRLAFPIYAYMIAEGCRYTHDRGRYFFRLASLTLVCQGAYYGAMRSLYQCVLVTFSLSVCLICALDNWRKERSLPAGLLALGAVLAVGVLCLGLPPLLAGTDYAVDYGIWGVLLPVLVYFGRDRRQKLALLALGTALLGLAFGGIQWWGMAAVPLLMCYSGARGKHRMGMLFYLYYPLHLAVIYGLSLLMEAVLPGRF